LRVRRKRGLRRLDGRARGQSVVEFAIVVPILALLLLGMLEFGLAFNHHMTIEYSTREGARTGSALAKGGSLNCVGGVDAQAIDAQTIAAAQRILKSPGSPVRLSDIADIRVYEADAAGNQVGSQVNVWRYTPGAGPDLDPSAAVDRLDFSPTSTGWPVCARSSGPNPDSLAVRISYTYRFSTPLGSLLSFLGGASMSSLTINDRTVMALNPER
jgi:Flp pilus assembly protein TadG